MWLTSPRRSPESVTGIWRRGEDADGVGPGERDVASAVRRASASSDIVRAASGHAGVRAATAAFLAGDSAADARCGSAAASAAGKASVCPEPVVEVLQREHAVVGMRSRAAAVTSADATTCVIVCAFAPGTGRVGMGHVDSQECAESLGGPDGFFDAIVVKCAAAAPRGPRAGAGALLRGGGGSSSGRDGGGGVDGNGVQLALVGAYTPKEAGTSTTSEAATSIDNVTAVLRTAQQWGTRHGVAVQCVLNCTLDANTVQARAGHDAPAVTSCAADVRLIQSSGSLVAGLRPGPLALPPPPLVALRSCRVFSSLGASADVWRDDDATVVVQPFDFGDALPPGTAAHIALLPDEFVLPLFSTSPLVEPPHFAESLRRSLAFMEAHPDPFPDGRPVEHRLLK